MERNNPEALVAWLRSPEAIRARCAMVRAAAELGRLEHFTLDLDRLDAAADYVIATIRAHYPDLAIPYHSRWRHFAAGGKDRWRDLAQQRALEPAERGRIRVELAITSVLLDAGAGERWRYREAASGQTFSRSEGLAVASFAMYAAGVFANDARRPLRVDAQALQALDQETLGQALQAGAANPLVGLAGRAALLHRLGAALAAQSAFFGVEARLGNLFDYLAAQARDHRLPAADILRAVLESLGAIWPGRIALGGVNLGDVWRHPAARSHDLSDGLVPFHKLSQWLSYSLVEPLEEAGLTITDLDALTGLPEYRNGGLFIDLEVLRPNHAAVLTATHAVDSEIVVEWRALTVSLLDQLAGRVRAKLGMDSATLPLAKVLEGGTWSAGRRSARERRADGSPPLKIASDGTVF